MGLGIEILVGVIVLVWAVSKIRSTSEVLATSVNALSASVKKLDRTVDHLRDRLGELDVRIAKLEVTNHHDR